MEDVAADAEAWVEASATATPNDAELAAIVTEGSD